MPLCLAVYYVTLFYLGTVHCSVLFCIIVLCIVLYCSVLYSVLYCSVLYCIVFSPLSLLFLVSSDRLVLQALHLADSSVTICTVFRTFWLSY
jgi:hypothetical protein